SIVPCGGTSSTIGPLSDPGFTPEAKPVTVPSAYLTATSASSAPLLSKTANPPRLVVMEGPTTSALILGPIARGVVGASHATRAVTVGTVTPRSHRHLV